MVSIIIPNFNKEKQIVVTLQSVLNQEYKNWECIIVDDWSNDNSQEIINKFIINDNRFSFFLRPEIEPKGPSSCRNIGIEKAKGEYIIFLDSDDLLVTFCLKNRVQEFEKKSHYDFLVFQMQRFIQIPEKVVERKLEEIIYKNVLSSFLQLQSLWQVTSPIYKTVFLKNIGGFNPNLINFEDLELASKAVFNASNYIVFNNIDSFYRNDENYKIKYSQKIQISQTIDNFLILIVSIHDKIIQKEDNHELKKRYKKDILVSYKKLFLSSIIKNIDEYKQNNKLILNFFKNNNYLNTKDFIKFYFTQNILIKFYRIKGFGLYRLISFLYK